MAKKLTIEEFVSRSKEVWGEDTFDYSKVEYRNVNTKVTLTCTKHGIEFEQQPNNHLKGQISCSECIYEKYGQHKSGYWTYERCYETAKKYEWLSDFTKQEGSCFNVSRKNNWLKDFTWLKRHYDEDEDIITSRKHLIYRYVFPEYNCIYIGLTMALEKRHKRGHSKKGTVYNFCKTNNIEIPEPQIIEDNLTLDEAKNREGYWIERYREQGYNLLNKAKAGSVGTLCTIKTGKETEQFISKAKEVHGNRYNYDKVVYEYSQKKVIIICPTHGDFLQEANRHLQGQGCPKCSCVQKSSTEEFVVKAKQVHGGKYDYSKTIYKNNKMKIIITCATHGDFEQTPHSHLQGRGCPKCKIKKVGNMLRGTKEQFIIKAKEVHRDRYDYSKVEYINNCTKVIITCPIHGEYTQTPNSHLLGCGCPKCASKERGDRCRLTKEQFISKAKEIHGDKYDYFRINYTNNQTKVIIICSVHGDFKQTPHSHLGGNGCPKCGEERRTKTNTKWTYEACKVESKKYKSRGELQKGNGSAYLASWKNKWLNDFFPKK